MARDRPAELASVHDGADDAETRSSLLPATRTWTSNSCASLVETGRSHFGEEVSSALKLLRNEGLQAYGVSCLESARRVWPAYLGSTMEFYELVTYLYAGAALQRNFFSQSGAISSSLGVWIGHSCTFLIRPIGGVVFGWVGDCYGRRVSMLATVIGMSAATALIGCIPRGPWGSYLLLSLKVLQGLFVSGEGPAAVVYSIERSRPETACLTGTSLFVSAVYFGILLASLATFVASASMDEGEYLAWGWRIPFLAALPMGAAAVALRRELQETEAFKVVSFRRRGDQSTAGTGWPNTEASSAAAKPSEPGESCSRLQHWATVLLGMLCVSGNPAGAYGGLLYFPAFLSSTAGLYSVKVTALMSMVSTVVGMLASPVCGVLGDLFGPGRMLLLGAVLVAVLSWPLWLLAVSGGTTLAFLAMSLWAIMLAVQGGVYATFLADLFPTESRATGVGASYNLAFAIFGGLCPLVETLLWQAANGSDEWPGWWANSCPALLLCVVGILGVAANITLRRFQAMGGRIGQHHLREVAAAAETVRCCSHSQEMALSSPRTSSLSPVKV